MIYDGPGASVVRDHPFVPRGAWYEVCGHWYGIRFELGEEPRPTRCGLAEAAHLTTTLTREEQR